MIATNIIVLIGAVLVDSESLLPLLVSAFSL